MQRSSNKKSLDCCRCGTAVQAAAEAIRVICGTCVQQGATFPTDTQISLPLAPNETTAAAH